MFQLRLYLIVGTLGAGSLYASTGNVDVCTDEAMDHWVACFESGIHRSSTTETFLAVNLSGGYQASMDRNGFEFKEACETPAWTARFQVLGLGRDDAHWTNWRSTMIKHDPQDLRIHGDGLTVQYKNGPEGLRQNFLVGSRVEGKGGLRVHMSFSGGLIAVAKESSGLSFIDQHGQERFTYTNLLVWDACGQILPAQLICEPGCDDVIAIEVDDAHATYPIVIDPVASVPSTTILGPISLSQFGRAVSGAGDLNGDGYSDVVIGAPNGAAGENNEGLAYVYYGSATGVGTVPNVVLQSNQVNAFFGYSVSTAGDVNGDGFSDLLIGAQNWESVAAEAQEGAVFVFHGSATGIGTVPNTVLESNVTLTYMGFSVACAGDINNDGFSDIIAGAPYANFPSSLEGAAYVFLGSAAGVNPVVHKRLERNQSSAQFGVSVAGAGDVNGDGFSDIAVGGFNYINTGFTERGIVCIYHGSPTGLAAGANPAPTLTLTSIGSSTNTGWCVSTAGDVNGDGYSDLAVGDWSGQVGGGPVEEGSVLVFHGSATGLATTPATVLQSNQANQLFGRGVSTAGDVNGDGYADLIVGAVTATYGQSLEGAAYLYLGSPTGIPTTFLYRYELNLAGGNMGETVRTAGDVNGDGYSDVIVGVKLSDRAVIYHGGPYSIATTPTTVRYSSVAGARCGAAVANAGDVNGDGYSDAVIGAPDASNGQAGEGLVYVHYGSTTGLSVAPNLTLEMNVAGARFGYSVSSAGDVNGDGYAEVIVGAPNSAGTGRAYIFRGSAAGLVAAPMLTITGTAGSELGFSVCAAGDVNSNGYADVVIGAPGINTAYVHWGTTSGTWPTPQSTFIGPAASRFGAAVGTAGDVNGSGYSSVIIGAPNYSNGQINEGAAYVYHGSNGGLGFIYNTLLESNVANALFGTSVAGVGDVNGNGYYEVAVGAPGWASGQAGEGGTFIYYGTPAGITAVGMQTVQSNVVGAQLGFDVNEAGDVNGDGYADIVIGVPTLTNGQTNEGRLYVVEGAAVGLGATTQVESNVASAQMGWSVAGGGDVNGDGYSDIIGGAPEASPSFASEGGYFLFNGNQSRSLDRRTRQYLADLVSPLSTNSLDFANLLYFGIGHRARSPIQRDRGRLRWEVVFEGQPFTGAPITNSLGFTAISAAWTDLNTTGAEIKQLVTKTPSHIRYKWRVRVEYPLNKLIDGQRFSRWFYGYAPGLGDIGILPVDLVSFTGKAAVEGNTLSWITGSENGSDHFVIERSTSGWDFEPIGEVAAAFVSQTSTDYGFLDRNSPEGTSYYRLRMVDRDGTEVLSDMIALTRGKGKLILYPVPVSDLLSWTGQENVARALVMDALGRVVIDERVGTGGVNSIRVADLQDGQYVLELRDTQGDPLAHSRFTKAQAPIAR